MPPARSEGGEGGQRELGGHVRGTAASAVSLGGAEALLSRAADPGQESRAQDEDRERQKRTGAQPQGREERDREARQRARERSLTGHEDQDGPPEREQRAQRSGVMKRHRGTPLKPGTGTRALPRPGSSDYPPRRARSPPPGRRSRRIPPPRGAGAARPDRPRRRCR